MLARRKENPEQLMRRQEGTDLPTEVDINLVGRGDRRDYRHGYR